MTEPTAAESAVTSSGLVVRAVLRTDVGKVRSENQDFGTLTTPEEERDAIPGGRLLIVADGMGGHRGGATASRLAGETLKAQYLGAETTDISLALREALGRANARVFTEAQANPDLRGMGTTVSALAVRGSNAWFAHVGDSRIYMVRGAEIRQLTEDHSLVASMVREGLLTSKEAETHPRRNVLQRSIGVSDEVEIDVKGPFEVQEGDTFVLCSDGLHGLVKEEELREVVRLDLEKAADEFVRRALDRGAPDNVTVIVARVERRDDDELDDTLTDTPSHDQAREAMEETVREGAVRPSGAFPVSGGSVHLSAPAHPPESMDGGEGPMPGTAPGERTGGEARELRAAGGSLLKWTLILVLVLGVAGLWLYWNHHQTVEDAAPASTSR